MSNTYSIVCDECKVAYWCGQSDYIYCKEKMAEFLHEHLGHTLRFVIDCGDDSIVDYRDWEDNKRTKSGGE
jgi:hypothetical protein